MTRALKWMKMRHARATAFGIHMLLSLLGFSSLVAMMILYWFPGDLFFIDSGWQSLILVAMVVLVLGPALSSILIRPGNPGMVLDMSMVAAIQISALGYGFYTMHQQRTVAVVYAGKGFHTLSAQDNLAADRQLLALNQQPRPLPATSMLQVPILLIPIPENRGNAKILEDADDGFPAPQERSDQYAPLAGHHDAISPDALSLEQLTEQGSLQAVERALEKRSLKPEAVEFYPFQARFESGIAVFDPDTLQIVDFIALDEQALLAPGKASGDAR